jgi:hypothetical protein
MTLHRTPELITLRSPSTLIGANLSTNFVYKVESLNPSLTGSINSINTGNKVKDKIEAIRNNGGRLTFERTESEIFRKNLEMIDSSMPTILAEMLLGSASGAGRSCTELSEYVGRVNPLQEDGEFYDYKIKEFLRTVALGMPCATKWDWRDRSYVIFTVINESGDVLTFDPYSIKELKRYLLQNTTFETRHASECRFGDLYVGPDGLRIDLNLQICLI